MSVNLEFHDHLAFKIEQFSGLSSLIYWCFYTLVLRKLALIFRQKKTLLPFFESINLKSDIYVSRYNLLMLYKQQCYVCLRFVRWLYTPQNKTWRSKLFKLWFACYGKWLIISSTFATILDWFDQIPGDLGSSANHHEEFQNNLFINSLLKMLQLSNFFVECWDDHNNNLNSGRSKKSIPMANNHIYWVFVSST